MPVALAHTIIHIAASVPITCIPRYRRVQNPICVRAASLFTTRTIVLDPTVAHASNFVNDASGDTILFRALVVNLSIAGGRRMLVFTRIFGPVIELLSTCAFTCELITGAPIGAGAISIW
jgi:hypothetical protein